MNFTGCIECGSLVIENEALHLCASCNHARRKAEKDEIRNAGKKRKVIAEVSEKMKGKLKTYKELRKEYLAKNPFCKARLQDCTGHAKHVHHLSGRGSKLNAEETFMAVCFNCHRILHDKLSATERREKGLMI